MLCCVLLCCTVRASWWLSLVVPVWCGGTRRKWVRGNNSVPQASTIVTDYPLPPPVSHGYWTTLIPEQRFKMLAEVVITLGKAKCLSRLFSFGSVDSSTSCRLSPMQWVVSVWPDFSDIKLRHEPDQLPPSFKQFWVFQLLS